MICYNTKLALAFEALLKALGWLLGVGSVPALSFFIITAFLVFVRCLSVWICTKK
jgi:hypothetical protein